MGRLARMQRGTGPLIRPASRRRPTRQQIARRRAFVVFLVVLPGRWGWSPGYMAADVRLVRRDGERAGMVGVGHGGGNGG